MTDFTMLELVLNAAGWAELERGFQPFDNLLVACTTTGKRGANATKLVRIVKQAYNTQKVG